MTIEILYFPDCPNYLSAVQHVQEALREEHRSAAIQCVQVLDAAKAAATGFLGSPTVRINGFASSRPRGQEAIRVCAVARMTAEVGGRARQALPSFARPFGNSLNPERIAVSKSNYQTGRGTILASTAALATAVAASSCCLPLLPFVAAAGLAGSSAWFSAIRPYLLAFSVLCIALAFFQSHRAKQCNCRRSRLSVVVLWISAAIVAVMILFPQAVADLLAGA